MTLTLNAGSVPSFVTVSVYTMVPPFWTRPAGVADFAIVISMNEPFPALVTVVETLEMLSNSLPSGIVLSGSTMAWLMYVPGMSGANIFTVMFRVTGTPGTVRTVPLRVPPVHVTTSATAMQLKASGPETVSLASMYVEPPGRKSRTAMPNAGLVPLFSTSRL